MVSKNEILGNRMYQKCLKMVYKLLGNGLTYSDQLNYVGKHLLGVKYKGSFPSDKIPKLSDLAPYCILNLDKSNESGSHWVGLAKVPLKNECYIYDSFGRKHTTLFKNLNSSGNGRINNTRLDPEQSVKESDCGARSMAWLILFDQKGYDVAKRI